MINKRLQKLLEELENVPELATTKDEPEITTPDQDNDDLFPADEHEEAEEVESVFVEGNSVFITVPFENPRDYSKLEYRIIREAVDNIAATLIETVDDEIDVIFSNNELTFVVSGKLFEAVTEEEVDFVNEEVKSINFIINEGISFADIFPSTSFKLFKNQETLVESFISLSGEEKDTLIENISYEELFLLEQLLEDSFQEGVYEKARNFLGRHIRDRYHKYRINRATGKEIRKVDKAKGKEEKKEIKDQTTKYRTDNADKYRTVKNMRKDMRTAKNTHNKVKKATSAVDKAAIRKAKEPLEIGKAASHELNNDTKTRKVRNELINKDRERIKTTALKTKEELDKNLKATKEKAMNDAKKKHESKIKNLKDQKEKAHAMINTARDKKELAEN